MKTTVIHHSADFDGLFCREIARKFLPPDTEFIGWDFKDAPLDTNLLHSQNKIYVLDLPFDRPFGLEFKGGWICKGAEQIQPIDRWDSGNIIWIDHHKTSIDTHPKEIPGYRIDGVAACRLAYAWFKSMPEHATPNFAGRGVEETLPSKQQFIDNEVTEPLAVRLAGMYDIWDKRDPRAETFQLGLRSLEGNMVQWNLILDGNGGAYLDELLRKGALLQGYQQRIDKSVVSGRSFIVEFEGLKFLALNTARCNSLTFSALDVPATGHDALMGFYFDGQKWNVSLYHASHRTEIDLSAIAKKYDGGGHRGACGFNTVAQLPFFAKG